MSRAPVEAGLRYNDPDSRITTPAWLQWFQQSFDRMIQSFNGRYGAVMPQAGDYTTALVASTTDKRYLTDTQLAVVAATSGTNTGDVLVTQVFADATAGLYSAAILAANDPTAPAYYEIFKTDASVNAVRVTPASGTVRMLPNVDLTVQGEGIRLVRSASDNNWYII